METVVSFAAFRQGVVNCNGKTTGYIKTLAVDPHMSLVLPPGAVSKKLVRHQHMHGAGGVDRMNCHWLSLLFGIINSSFRFDTIILRSDLKSTLHGGFKRLRDFRLW